MLFFENLFEELKKPFLPNDKEKIRDSSQITKVDHNNDFISFDSVNGMVSASLDQQNQIKTQNAMIVNCRKISYLPEIDDALTEIITESIVYDSEEPIITLQLDELEISDSLKEKINESFNKILFLLDFNVKGDEIFRQWFIDGIIHFENVYDNSKMRKGIQKIIPMSPFDLHKSKDDNGKIIYFYGNTDRLSYSKVDKEKIYSEEQVSSINSGLYDTFNKIYLSPIVKALKAINQLNLIEDSLVIYRITRSSEKRAIYVDTGNLPKTKAEEYVKGLMNRYRQKKVYDPATGTVEDANKKISILEDFWFPVASGVNGQRGTRIETIAGSNPNFAGLEDLDYFVNKVYRSLHIPISRRSSDAVYSSGTDIVKEELKFFKYIIKLRRKFNNLFVDLIKKDLIAKSIFSIDDWNSIQEKINFSYATSNEFSLLKKMQILDLRLSSASNASALLQEGIISKMWIRREILGLTDEEIEVMLVDDLELENMLAGATEENETPEGDTAAPEGGDVGDVPSSWTMDVPTETEEPSVEKEEPEETTKPETKSETEDKPKKKFGRSFRAKRKESIKEKGSLLQEEVSPGEIITNGTKSFLITTDGLVEI